MNTCVRSRWNLRNTTLPKILIHKLCNIDCVLDKEVLLPSIKHQFHIVKNTQQTRVRVRVTTIKPQVNGFFVLMKQLFLT